MSLPLLFVLFIAICVYWTVTQILPERRSSRLRRPGLADGLLEEVNDLRHSHGLPGLELDGELADVAEKKAMHELLTSCSTEGWDYPTSLLPLLGRSLLMEVLIQGQAEDIGRRLARQRDLLDNEWVRCGIGVAGAPTSKRIVVAMVLCRDAWELSPELPQQRSLAERLMIGN